MENYSPPVIYTHRHNRTPYATLLSYLPSVQAKLKGKSYFAVLFSPRKLQPGGTIVIFLENTAPSYPMLVWMGDK